MLKWKFVILVLLIPTILFAQEKMKTETVSTIQVEGESIVHANPNRARVDLGVLTQSPDAKTAAAENAKKLD